MTQLNTIDVLVLLGLASITVNDIKSLERRLLTHQNVLHRGTFTAIRRTE